jgi:hypothetical protein
VIGIEEFVGRLCALGAERPRPLPRRRRDREILMKSIRMRVEPGRVYSEIEVNALLQAWQREVAPALEVDHVTLRRLLVDYGELERSRDGSAYRLGFPARPMAFALEVDDLDLPATVAAYREELHKRRGRS